MDAVRTGIFAMVAVAVAAGLGGCREDEQARALHLEKGVYSGKPDAELTEEQRRALAQRVRLQQF